MEHLQNILQTKIFVPPTRRETVSRQRLLDLIQKHYNDKLVLISAPAGFGKTTLISKWIEQYNIPVAWVSINQGDNDPVIFFSYIIAAIQVIDPKIGKSVIPVLQSPQPELNLVIINLIREIIDYREEIVLVLEDYHLVREKQIHNLVEFLADHKPGNLRMVIISRTDPMLPLHRYRAKDQLFEIRAGDLCFTDDEAYAFFNKIMGLNLTSGHVESLNTRAEGWITGLQMAALSLKSRDNIEGFIESFTGDNRYIMDYLLEEVIAVQSEPVKAFLLQTSILDRFSAHLCETVTGIENGQDIIDLLDRENLFVIPLDSNKAWYRYHHLFTDLLKKRLKASQPDILAELHSKASKWFADHDYIPEAIDHAILAKDWPLAAKLVERTFMNRMNRGEDVATMLARMKALPEEMICTRSSLCIMYAWMHSLALLLDDAETYLRHVENIKDTNLDADLNMQINVIRAEMARQRGDLTFSIKSTQEILNQIADNPSENHVRMQNFTGCNMNLAWSYLLTGEMEFALQKFQEILYISNEAGSIIMILVHMKGLAQVQMLMGRLNAAGDTLKKALEIINQSSLPSGQLPTAAAFIYLEYGNYLRERNQLNDARQYILKGLNLGEKRRIDGATLRDGYIYLARTNYALNDKTGMDKAFQDADLKLSGFFGIETFRTPLEIWKQTISLTSKENTSEQDQFNNLFPGQVFDVNPRVNSIHDELNYLNWARWLILTNQFTEAIELLDHLHPRAEKNGRKERVVTILILKAVAFSSSGDMQGSTAAIGQALQIAEPEEYCRIFVDEGSAVKEIIKEFSPGNNTVTEKYLNKILLSFSSDAAEIPELPDPLSKRELDVLYLLPKGISNKEIAETLFISVDTVKTHLKNINIKLNTGDRNQAVKRAKELGLL